MNDRCYERAKSGTTSRFLTHNECSVIKKVGEAMEKGSVGDTVKSGEVQESVEFNGE